MQHGNCKPTPVELLGTAMILYPVRINNNTISRGSSLVRPCLVLGIQKNFICVIIRQLSKTLSLGATFFYPWVLTGYSSSILYFILFCI